MGEVSELVKEVVYKMGLSRFLRYTYGSFILLFLSAVINPSEVQAILKDIPVVMLVFGSLIIGAGIYVLHRSILIPIHHFLLCVLFAMYDWLVTFKDPSHATSNPVGVIKTWGVPLGLKMIAYTVLRRADFFKDMNLDLNLAHAQNGLLVMTTEGMLFASIYSNQVKRPQVEWPIFLFLGVLFLVCSYPPSFVLHSLEGRFMKKDSETIENGKGILKGAGIPVT
ncbi:hypothetical protein ES707_17497 [subsurface metagenome]